MPGMTEVARQVPAAERAARAVELKAQGFTYEEIAVQLGYASKAGAYVAVVRALKLANEKSAELGKHYRDLELAKLDALESELWGVIRARHLVAQNGEIVRDPDGNPLTDSRPKVDAVEAMVKVSARRARLLGLDQSTDTQVGVQVNYLVQGTDLSDYQ